MRCKMPWVCFVCGKRFNLLCNLKKHFMRTHYDGRYCFICGREYSRVVLHAAKQSDDAHLAFAFLISTPHNNRFPKRVKEAVERVLWEEDDSSGGYTRPDSEGNAGETLHDV